MNGEYQDQKLPDPVDTGTGAEIGFSTGALEDGGDRDRGNETEIGNGNERRKCLENENDRG